MGNPDQTLIDERIRQELRDLEGNYSEADWQAIEPYVSGLQPPSAFKVNSKAIAVLILCIVLGTGLYFAIPYMQRLQEQKQNAADLDSSAVDTSSTDPNFRPDSNPGNNVAPVVHEPIAVDSSLLNPKTDTSQVVIKPPVTTPEATTVQAKRPDDQITRPSTTKPAKKKKQEVKPTDTQTPPPAEENPDNDLLKKETPIIAVPQEPEKNPETPPEQKEVPKP
jgi:hypothetical protein